LKMMSWWLILKPILKTGQKFSKITLKFTLKSIKWTSNNIKRLCLKKLKWNMCNIRKRSWMSWLGPRHPCWSLIWRLKIKRKLINYLECKAKSYLINLWPLVISIFKMKNRS
jgi:hypothetical protein